MRSLKKSERTLLWLCFAVFFIAANAFGANFVLKRIKKANQEVVQLENSLKEYKLKEFYLEEAMEQQALIEEHLPVLEAAGKVSGVMTEEIQNVMRDKKFESEKVTLIEPKVYDHYQEVAVSIRFKGDAIEIMRWLVTLQQKNQFYMIKYLELELDKKSEEKEPQARCNLTLARWFKPPENS